MKIGIIGAGATGLAAGMELTKGGHDVTILERSHELGGLAGSLHVAGTPIERFYHHIFETDKVIIDTINEVGLGDRLFWRALPTGIFYDDRLYDFGTPQEMLSFSPIPMVDRIRFAAASAFLKLLPNGRRLEEVNALDWCNRYMGRNTTKVIWEPLLRGKFGSDAASISMAWLWARIHCRTFKLGYIDGGFDLLYEAMAKRVTDLGGAIAFDQQVDSIRQFDASSPVVVTTTEQTYEFDRVISTTPQPVFAKAIGAQMDDELWQNHYLGATCFILEVDRSVIPHYWLNINDPSFPFLAVVEHTKLVDKAQYGGKHVVYVGNYVPRDDWRYTEEPAIVLEKFVPYLRRINPEFSLDWVSNWQFSRAGYAQPIVTPEYRKHIPPHTTPLPGVMLATMAQVYPQDRGQNFAIKMGNQVARMITA